MIRIGVGDAERHGTVRSVIDLMMDYGLNFRMNQLAAKSHRLMEIGRTNEEHVKSFGVEQGIQVGEGVDMLELDDDEDTIVDCRHELRHRPALAVVKSAAASEAPQ